MSSNPKLIAGCRLWDKVTRKAFEGDYVIPDDIQAFRGTLYNAGDYHELQCRITEDIAELTVGAVTGHKAKFDLKKKRLDYFDGRSENNRVMWLILNNVVKLKCKRDETGVHCTGLTSKAKINNAFKALASPTSMDFRRSHCYNITSLEECREREVDFFRKGPLKEK